jgi:hypothetical protein
MDYYLRRIDLKSASLTFLGIGSIFGCVFAVLTLIFGSAKGQIPGLPELGLIMFSSALWWTVGGALFTLAYNFISSRLGGIKFQFEEAENDPSAQEVITPPN